MAILSGYKEERQTQTTSNKPFTAAFDPSNPLGFLEKAFEFVVGESDLFKSDFLIKNVSAVVGMVKEKVEVEAKKRKELKRERIVRAEKKMKEDSPLAKEVKKEELKPEVMEEEKGSDAKEEEKNEPRGILQILLFAILLFITTGFCRIRFHTYTFCI